MDICEKVNHSSESIIESLGNGVPVTTQNWALEPVMGRSPAHGEDCSNKLQRGIEPEGDRLCSVLLVLSQKSFS